MFPSFFRRTRIRFYKVYSLDAKTSCWHSLTFGWSIFSAAAMNPAYCRRDTLGIKSIDDFIRYNPPRAPACKQSGSLQGHDCEGMPDTIADGLRTTLGSSTWPVVRLVARSFS